MKNIKQYSVIKTDYLVKLKKNNISIYITTKTKIKHMIQKITKYEYCNITDTYNMYTNTPIGIPETQKITDNILINYDQNKKISMISLLHASDYDLDYIHDIFDEISIDVDKDWIYLDVLAYNQGMCHFVFKM